LVLVGGGGRGSGSGSPLLFLFSLLVSLLKSLLFGENHSSLESIFFLATTF
jgi:hypothetical protein